MPQAFCAPSVSDKQKDLKKIKSEIDAIDVQLDDVVESYNEANYYLGKTEENIKQLTSEIDSLEDRIQENEENYNLRIRSMYMSGTISFLEVVLAASSFNDFVEGMKYFLVIADRESKMIRSLDEDRLEATEKKGVLLAEKAKQKELVDRLSVDKDQIEKKLKEKNSMLAKVQGEINQIKEKQNPSPSKSNRSYSSGKSYAYTPSRGAPRSNVVNIALSLLGKPYRYGAAGPNSFDCSGFTMYVYAKVGVSLPHSSRAQYNYGTRIPRNQLAPGDLVFFARSKSISHVGIYVGNGNFIHAPQTGEVVRVQSLASHRGYVGAVRP